MNWYLAKLVFSINIDNGKQASQFDEQTRLIQAGSLEQAFYKARSIGKQEEETFLNKNNNLVSWKFIDVVDLHALQDLKDGGLVYSTTHEKEESSSFIQFIRQKSMVIQTEVLAFV